VADDLLRPDRDDVLMALSSLSVGKPGAYIGDDRSKTAFMVIQRELEWLRARLDRAEAERDAEQLEPATCARCGGSRRVRGPNRAMGRDYIKTTELCPDCSVYGGGE